MQPGTFGIAARTSPLAAGRTFMVTRACHKPGVSAKKTWKHRRTRSRSYFENKFIPDTCRLVILPRFSFSLSSEERGRIKDIFRHFKI